MRTDDRRARIDEICEAALDRPPGERASLVAAACGDDTELRREVDALLAHAGAAEGFLTQPIAAMAADVFIDAGGDGVGVHGGGS